MKFLLLAVLVLASPSAFAFECYSDELVVGNGTLYVTRPALILNKDQNRHALFIVPDYRGADLGNNLCKLCGYGNKASALSYLKVGPGPSYAVLDSHGQLSRVGQIEAVSYAVDSLTCEQ